MIRPYEQKDFEHISAIYDAAKPEEFRAEKSPIAVTPLSNDHQLMSTFKQSTVYVFSEDSVTGFSGTRGNELVWLFVHPNSWGRGIARRLALHALSHLEGIATLNVTRSNIAAINLYQRLGFNIVKQSIGYYQTQPIEALTMSIELTQLFKSQ